MDYEVDFERLDQESLAWERPPSEEQKQLERELFGKLRDPKPKFKSFSKRLKNENRYEPAALWDEIFMSDDKEKYMEELRKQHQAKLSRRLHMETARRLGVTEHIKDIPLSTWLSLIRSELPPAMKNSQQLQVLRNSMQLRVSIHPYMGRGRREQLETGTLQAHANGFRFSNYSSRFQMDVMFGNVKRAFFQKGHEKMTPLLHLHLHNPIMLGTETTKNIQFHMVHISGGRRSKGSLALDSDKLDKEEKTVDNELAQKFVWKANSLLGPLVSVEFTEIRRNQGFPAHSSVKKDISLFFMTYDCLVHLREPFLVATLKEIAVVNLVKNLSGKEVLDMTFVFMNFGRDVLHINSVPSEYLLRIKDWRDVGDVKYYENKQDVSNWQAKLKMITDEPTSFITNGGWDFLNSGETVPQYSDSSAESLANYSDMTSEEESDSGPSNKNQC